MKKFTFLALLMVIGIIIVTLPASAGVETTIGAAFQVFSEKNTDVRAGITPLMTTSNTASGADKTFHVPGTYPCIPRFVGDETGFLDMFNFVRINFLVMGIAPERIVNEKVTIQGVGRAAYDFNRGIMTIDMTNLPPGQYYLAYDITHSQNRRDRTVLIVFHFVEHPESTDQIAIVFSVLDGSKFFDRYCLKSPSKVCFEKASEDLKIEARRAYLDQEVKSFRPTTSDLGFGLATWLDSQTRASEANAKKAEIRQEPVAKDTATVTFRSGFSSEANRRLEITGGGESRTVELTRSGAAIELRPGQYTACLIVDGARVTEMQFVVKTTRNTTFTVGQEE